MPDAQAPVLVEPPELPPVTLAQARLHLKDPAVEENPHIEMAIATATQRLDGYGGLLRRALVTQTWRQDLDAFPCGPIVLALAPVQSITHVRYRDLDGVEQTLDESTYHLVVRAGDPMIERASGVAWPATAVRPDAVRVTFVAGYGAPDAVPSPIKNAILLMVGDLHAQRETFVTGTISSQVPMSTRVEDLLGSYRRLRV